jgi:hypothetical protein
VRIADYISTAETSTKNRPGNHKKEKPVTPPLSYAFASSDAGEIRICGRLEVFCCQSILYLICIFGQMALLYLAQKRELIISLSQAHDLVPRPDGILRNPYVKLFLLPDRR